MRIGKIVGVWAVVAGLLFWNGVLALGVYKPFLGAEAGEMMSAFVAMAAIFGATRAYLVHDAELPIMQLIRIGLLWVALTFIYEIALGRLATWAVPRVAPAYGMWDGSFWPLIVMATAFAPIVWLRRSDVPFGRITK
jgi:hypothetical protein